MIVFKFVIYTKDMRGTAETEATAGFNSAFDAWDWMVAGETVDYLVVSRNLEFDFEAKTFSVAGKRDAFITWAVS